MSNSNTESGTGGVHGSSGPVYANPVHPGYLADPFVWKHDGRYFAVGTGAEEAEGRMEAARDGVFPILGSEDLVHWTPLGRAMEHPEFGAAYGESFWAPEVAFADGWFFLYYSVGRGDQGHQLRVAMSRAPEGPYHDSGAGLTDPGEWLFAIDPHPFRDTDGRWYLFFAADFLDAEPLAPGSVRAGTALVAQPLENMTRLGGRGRVILRPRHDWQRFQANRAIYGGRFDWHTLEGPCVRERGGRYYCFFSGGRWETDGYGVDYAVAVHVLGPYSEAGGESGPRILKTVPGRVLGPGHNSIVENPDGSGEYLAYHAWDRDKRVRRLCIDPLVWDHDRPRCNGPSWSAQPAPRLLR